MEADGLFKGEATLRKIFCLQETLRGVATSAAPTESLLQVDRVLFLPSPLLPERRQPSATHTHTHTHTARSEIRHHDLKSIYPSDNNHP